MKNLIFILLINSSFAQISPYISTGANISLNNHKGIFDKNNGIRWGYEITAGIISGPILHLKMSYGKKYFKNSRKFINYYAFGGGVLIGGYEKGSAMMVDENNNSHKAKRSNIYLGGFIFPIAVAWDITGMVQAGILPTNFYSREKFIFSDTTYVNHNIWQKFSVPMTKCLACN